MNPDRNFTFRIYITYGLFIKKQQGQNTYLLLKFHTG